MNKTNEIKLDNKKLLIISPHFLTFVKDQVLTLAEHFSEIIVIVPLNCRPYLQKFKQLKKDMQLIDSSNIPKNVTIVTPKSMSFPFSRKLNECLIYRSVNTIIHKENIKFDLIHSHFTYPSGLIGVKLKHKYKKPLIITAHGYDIYDLPFRNKYWKTKIKYVLDSADNIITVSNKNSECVKNLNVTSDVKIILNGFDENRFYLRDSTRCKEKLDLPNNKKIILTVGNLVEIKGQKYLIKAINKIVDKRKDVLLIIVGKGILKQELENLVQDLNLEDHVLFAGGKPHNEIPIWMNACDVFVLPSLNEGIPTVMFECLGCGKPFVGTKVGGIPDIIISKDYGSLVKPKKFKELAEAILIALDEDWDNEIIKRYAKRFRYENIIGDIMNVYKIADEHYE